MPHHTHIPHGQLFAQLQITRQQSFFGITHALIPGLARKVFSAISSNFNTALCSASVKPCSSPSFARNAAKALPVSP